MKICWDLRWPLDVHSHVFPLGTPGPVPEGVFFDGDYYDAYRYTEVQQQGLAYHEYGLWWDREQDRRQLVFPSSVAELLISGLQYGTRVYAKTGYWGLVDFEFSLLGVRGRKFYEPTGFSGLLASESGAFDDHITVRVTESVSGLIANGVEIARHLLTDIAWAFGRQSYPEAVARLLAAARM